MTRSFARRLLVLAAPLAGCALDNSGAPQIGASPVSLRDAAAGALDAATDVPDADAGPGSLDASATTDDGGGAPPDAETAGDAGVPSDGTSDAGSAADASVADYPQLLSQTGLFVSGHPERLSEDVRGFEPRYKLWSDGAEKRRFLRIPRGTRIDTSDMDGWRFPVGTKAWKEFTVDGVRVETRMLHKRGEQDWVMVSYRWRSDARDAEAVPEGVMDAAGTSHDIPGQELCASCHGNLGDVLLGVSALQLSHSGAGLTLEKLAAAGELTKPPVSAFVIPGGALAEQALGYLHANCGHCHNPASEAYARILARPPYTGGPILWERTDALATLSETVGYRSTVGQPNSVLPDLPIIQPGKPDRSELFIRISQRGPGSLQMPPIATEHVDEGGKATIAAWIASLGQSAP